MQRTKYRWFIRHQWLKNGNRIDEIKRETEMVFLQAMKHQNAQPVGNLGQWYSETKWWKHRQGWRFHFDGIKSWITSTFQEIMKNLWMLLKHPIVSGTISIALGAYIVWRMGWLNIEHP